jgi:hypothetical protein
VIQLPKVNTGKASIILIDNAQTLCRQAGENPARSRHCMDIFLSEPESYLFYNLRYTHERWEVD